LNSFKYGTNATRIQSYDSYITNRFKFLNQKLEYLHKKEKTNKARSNRQLT